MMDYLLAGTRERFKDIEEFIFATKNFDWETIDTDKGNLIDTLFDNKNSSDRK